MADQIFQVSTSSDPTEKCKYKVTGLLVVAQASDEILAEMIATRLNETLDQAIEEITASLIATHRDPKERRYDPRNQC